MTTARSPRMPARALYAAGLLAAALAVLLGAWFLSGWADVRAQQRELAAAPVHDAERKATELAGELRAELGRLMSRELERPYFHYQNLMHDPRTSGMWSVAPSPLASGPEDPLVLGYFQLDPKGGVTTPTINDAFPELSERRRLAEHRRFRDEVLRDLAGALTPKPGVLVAEAAPQVKKKPPQQKRVPAQVIEIDPNSYVQNYSGNANEVYQQQRATVPDSIELSNESNVPVTRNQRNAPPQTQQQAPPVTDVPPPKPKKIRRARPVVPEPEPAPTPITITISPLEWRTFTFAGAPTLVAVREVETPDGLLAQGFVVDRSVVTSWLATRAGASVAQLGTHNQPSTAEVAPGWHLAVSANPRALVEAAANAAGVANGFLLRFILVGVIAALALAFVVSLVARAERLARERSQFAAAAAHELRTPLAGLQLYGDMLADGLGDPGKMRDYARRMSEEASRLGRVVSNVLGFSQLERGNLSVEPTTGNLGRELAELAERAQPALDRAGAVLELDVPPELAARFDRDALARIVGNLLDNAEKYGREAEDRTIGLTARETGDAVEVVVSDHGPGVTQATHARLFRPFTRGVTSDGPAGLGRGLALSQALARAMGGELEYRADAGAGATFVLRLAR
ncbi:MAG: HAMP domain-containing sensor histidine kinase [Kofleriaceae bacterium]